MTCPRVVTPPAEVPCRLPYVRGTREGSSAAAVTGRGAVTTRDVPYALADAVRGHVPTLA